MAIEAHLEKLNKRHQELEAQIENEKKHAASDDLRIVELKRRKLRIKDELEEFRMQAGSP